MGFVFIDLLRLFPLSSNLLCLPLLQFSAIQCLSHSFRPSLWQTPGLTLRWKRRDQQACPGLGRSHILGSIYKCWMLVASPLITHHQFLIS